MTVRSYAEAIKEYVRLGGYISCATDVDYNNNSVYIAPDGYNVSLETIQSQASSNYNVILVLDRSSSIALDSSSTPQKVKNAGYAFIDGVADSGASLSVISFGTSAKIETPTPVSVTSGANVAALKAAVNAIVFGPASPQSAWDYTNWEDALIKSITQFGNFPTGYPPLIVLVTDGEPNYYINDSTGNVDGDPYPYSAADVALATAQARAQVNDIQSWESRIFAVGVGDVTVSGLKEISRPTSGTADEYPATPFIDAEWTQASSYAALQVVLHDVATSVASEKYSTDCPNPDQGAQRLTLTASSDDGTDVEKLDIVVRNPHHKETP